MTKPIVFFLPMPTFTWREKKTKAEGRCAVRCPKRGHCTVTRTGGSKPETKGNRKKVITIAGHSSIVESPRAIAAEAAVCKALRAHSQRPAEPMQNDVVFDVVFVFAVPKGWPKWKREAARLCEVRPTSTMDGDRDNLHKLIADALAGAGYYADDARISDGRVAKAYGPTAGYQIGLREKAPVPKTAKEWNGRMAL